MDRSYPYSRRLVSRARLRKRMAAVAAAGVVAATAVFMMAWKPDPIAAAVPPPFMPSMGLADVFGAGEPLRQGVRRIYPYSVVPGGVSGQAELKRIIRTDSVVAAHFATFDTGKTRALVVDKPRAVHVSYRKGDKVYWTAHKVMLAPGETLLSDGRNEMRARCANRISELPQYPVEAHKPAMEELDQPVELAEGERYTLGPDGIPVLMGGEGGIARHTGVRFPTRGGSAGGSTGSGSAGGSTGNGSAGAPAVGAPASSLSSSAGSMGPVTTMGLSGSSSSMGSPRPPRRPAAATTPDPASTPEIPTAPAPVPDAGSGSSSGSSGSPAPSGGGTAPVAEPVTDAPVSDPVPGTTPPRPPDSPTVDPKPEPSPPAPVPGTDPAPLPVTEQPPDPPLPPSGPSGNPPPSQPVPEPVAPKPTPLPPEPIEEPAPTEVPEPGSIWLFGLALAAMGVLRRPRRG